MSNAVVAVRGRPRVRGRRSALANQSLTERVYAGLRAELLRCELAPGSQIYEGELASRYRVSKTPVREALNSLRQEGLIQVLPRRGYQVTAITLKHILSLLELRLVLEGGAAGLAVQRASASDLAQLEKLAKASYQRGNKQSEAEFIDANRAFHMRVAELSGNERLVDLIKRCLEELQRVFHLGADLRNISDEVAQDHLDLVDALRRRDADGARRIVGEQTAHTRTNILGALTRGDGELPVHLEIEPSSLDKADLRSSARARRR